MGRTKLVIRKEQVNKNGLCVIYVLYTHNSKSVYFSTSEQIPLKDWDPKKCEIRKSFRGYTNLNELIQQFKGEIDDIKVQLRLKKIEPTIYTIKEEYPKAQWPDSGTHPYCR